MFVLETGTAFAKQGKGLLGETEGGENKQQCVANTGRLLAAGTFCNLHARPVFQNQERREHCHLLKASYAGSLTACLSSGSIQFLLVVPQR